VIPLIKHLRAPLASKVGVITGASFRSRRSFLEDLAAFYPGATVMTGGGYTAQKEARDG